LLLLGIVVLNFRNFTKLVGSPLKLKCKIYGRKGKQKKGKGRKQK
jgi:hypothetical protein